ncbi:SPOR domain-containing protein [Amaricoccus sp.]|uniref:SPOR domain-containing protein n=1 Tax=Amaricoccus sp. TaxID=1872485 RepID=UPI001B60EE73|nr:SPOR domain-containing protein [Amaricoccus sp.]MBP7000237.1 SPOR domain-containing protein [Amaricoccus sp.]
MSELYADEYDSLAAGSGRLVSDGARRVAGAVLFLALIGGLGLWAYRLGTRDAGEVPIIRAMEGPTRIQPEEPGGLRAAHQGLEVNGVLAGRPAKDPGADTTIAVTPNPLADEDAPQGELVVAAPAVTGEDALPAGEDLRMPLPDDGPSGVAAAPASPAATPENAVMAAVAEAVAAQSGADPAAVPADPAATPDPAATAAATGPGPMRRPSGLVRITAAAPAATATPAAAKAAAAPAAREVASVKSGTRLVQLGAFDSEGIARQAWNILSRRHADLLGSKSLYVERTTANARVFYRLRVAGFDSADQTRQMCEALRARGVDCIPVTLQ